MTGDPLTIDDPVRGVQIILVQSIWKGSKYIAKIKNPGNGYLDLSLSRGILAQERSKSLKTFAQDLFKKSLSLYRCSGNRPLSRCRSRITAKHIVETSGLRKFMREGMNKFYDGIRSTVKLHVFTLRCIGWSCRQELVVGAPGQDEMYARSNNYPRNLLDSSWWRNNPEARNRRTSEPEHRSDGPDPTRQARKHLKRMQAKLQQWKYHGRASKPKEVRPKSLSRRWWGGFCWYFQKAMKALRLTSR